MEEVVAFGVSQIAPSKIFLGVPNYGYDWALPYVSGESRARSIGNVEAVEIAVREGAEILFDPIAQAPFFFYTDAAGAEHEVWFEDAESIRAKLGLTDRFGLRGFAVWNLMRFFPQLWTVAGALYDIRRQNLQTGSTVL